MGKKLPLYSIVGTYKQPESTSIAKTSYSTLSRHFFCMEPPVPQHPTGRRRRMHLDRLPCLPPARVRTCSEHDTHNESDVRYHIVHRPPPLFPFSLVIIPHPGGMFRPVSSIVLHIGKIVQKGPGRGRKRHCECDAAGFRLALAPKRSTSPAQNLWEALPDDPLT